MAAEETEAAPEEESGRYRRTTLIRNEVTAVLLNTFPGLDVLVTARRAGARGERGIVAIQMGEVDALKFATWIYERAKEEGK